MGMAMGQVGRGGAGGLQSGAVGCVRCWRARAALACACGAGVRVRSQPVAALEHALLITPTHPKLSVYPPSLANLSASTPRTHPCRPTGLRAAVRGVHLDQRQGHRPRLGQDDAQHHRCAVLRCAALGLIESVCALDSASRRVRAAGAGMGWMAAPHSRCPPSPAPPPCRHQPAGAHGAGCGVRGRHRHQHHHLGHGRQPGQPAPRALRCVLS